MFSPPSFWSFFLGGVSPPSKGNSFYYCFHFGPKEGHFYEGRVIFFLFQVEGYF